MTTVSGNGLENTTYQAELWIRGSVKRILFGKHRNKPGMLKSVLQKQLIIFFLKSMWNKDNHSHSWWQREIE